MIFLDRITGGLVIFFITGLNHIELQKDGSFQCDAHVPTKLYATSEEPILPRPEFDKDQEMMNLDFIGWF